METKEKVSFIHSITAKIMLMVVVMVALSLMACCRLPRLLTQQGLTTIERVDDAG